MNLLYEIDQRITALADPETGEITDLEALESLGMERDQEIENVACWVKNLVAEAAAIKAEENALKERRSKIDAQVENLSGLLHHVLGGEKFKSARCTVSFRNNKAVEYTDIMAVADWCENNGHMDLVEYGDPKVGKKEIMKLLKAGEAVDGAKIVESVSVGVK